jgi:hypothetical protein
VKDAALVALACWTTLAAAVAPASAQSEGGTPPVGAAAPPLPPPDKRLFRILGVTVGPEGFAPITKLLGDAKVVTRSTGTRVICYVGSDSTRVVFEESATGWGYTIFSLITPPLELVTSNACTALFRLNQTTQNGTGLHTGQRRDELIDLLGQPQTGESQRLVWLFASEADVTPGSDPRLPPDVARVAIRTKIFIRMKHSKAVRITVFAHQSPLRADAAAPR